jgi:hypothetical protein
MVYDNDSFFDFSIFIRNYYQRTRNLLHMTDFEFERSIQKVLSLCAYNKLHNILTTRKALAGAFGSFLDHPIQRIPKRIQDRA